jgi:hypothetical protein
VADGDDTGDRTVTPLRPKLGGTGAEPGRTRTAIVVELLPVVLVILGEAAWISVVAGLLQEFALRDPVVGLPGMAAFVVAGVLLAAGLGPLLGRRWPAVAFGLVLGAASVGVLVSPAARAALAEGAGPTVAANPGGLLAGLAVLRGFAHARLPLVEGTVTNLLAIGIPGLAVASALGGLIGDPYRTRFLDDAFLAAVVFVATSALALAFARIDAMGIDSGFDWRRNPVWLLFAVVAIGVAIAIALPLATMAGTIVSIVVPVAFGPMLVVGLASGFDRTARRLVLFFGSILIVIYVLVRLFGQQASPGQPGGAGSSAQPPPSTFEQVVTIGLGGLLLAAAIVAVLVLTAVWMRRTPRRDEFPGETRTIDASGDGLAAHRRRRRFGRWAKPMTAVEAYVALIDELARHAPVRREPAETPAAHAARLRAQGDAGLSLELLAADHALARYGGATLSVREDRRGVARWRLLRRNLADVAERRIKAKAAASAADAELPVDMQPRRNVQA